ncbi:hypothetical protein CEXT_250641 [Caerostris extrusa]|uniref:Uncharacterized protein n=1 Tax=Caerostris extrusa TaxID=172846 RepID=A0AAV4N4Y3_CAEEX|nr:hypothetical protein CEXT_250641 [Caerostris extrusa]
MDIEHFMPNSYENYYSDVSELSDSEDDRWKVDQKMILTGKTAQFRPYSSHNRTRNRHLKLETPPAALNQLGRLSLPSPNKTTPTAEFKQPDGRGYSTLNVVETMKEALRNSSRPKFSNNNLRLPNDNYVYYLNLKLLALEIFLRNHSSSLSKYEARFLENLLRHYKNIKILD